jgi:hypothetical protein
MYTAALINNTDEILDEYLSNESNDDTQTILEVIGYVTEEEHIKKALDFAFNVS